MAISASTVWEVRTAGADDNGGGYAGGGTDYSQQDTKNSGASDKSTTDAVANGTTTITSATANFTTGIVGNIICLQGGTGSLTKTWRQVITRASSSSITVDAAVATGTGITMNIGGALLSLGMLGNTGAAVSGNTIWVKSGSYSITSASTNVSGGCFSKLSGTWYIRGYNSSRGDYGTAPVFTASGISTFTMLASSGGVVENIDMDGGNLTSSRGFDLTACIAYKCAANNHKNSGFIAGSGTCVLIRCTSTGCNTAGSAFNLSGSNRCHACIAYDNTVTAFTLGAGSTVTNCIADTNTGASSDGFSFSGANSNLVNCVAYANGRDGFRIGTGTITCTNCIAESNSGVGFNVPSNSTPVFFNNCAGFSSGTNMSIGTGTYSVNTGFVTGVSSFFVNAAGGNFALNNTASAGAAARAAGYPGTLVSSTGYVDIGAIQHADPTGGGAHSSVF